MLSKEQLVASLSEEELDMSVEEYLRAQCSRRVDVLKRHMASLVESFSSESKRARKTLVEVANNSAKEAANTEAEIEVDAASDNDDDSVDPFALLAIKGFHAGRVVRIQPSADKSVWTVGRVENNDVSLMGDDEVSSFHAQVSFERKSFKLMDLGSTNGTYATNGQGSTFKLKKKKNHILKVDHLVTFGSTTFKWCYYNDATQIAKQLKVTGGV